MSLSIRDLADRLLVYEAALDRKHQAELAETCHVCEKLRRSLGTLVGPEAYYSLLTHALSAAKRETSVLHAVQINPDGSIDGLFGEATEATNLLVAHLIGLVVTFIGATVTLWLLKEIWPNLPGERIAIQVDTTGIDPGL